MADESGLAFTPLHDLAPHANLTKTLTLDPLPRCRGAVPTLAGAPPTLRRHAEAVRSKITAPPRGAHHS